MKTEFLKIENNRYTYIKRNLRACVVAGDLDATVAKINKTFPRLICGRGGHHVWISKPIHADDRMNDIYSRIAIIYFTS